MVEAAQKTILITGVNGMLGQELVRTMAGGYCLAGLDLGVAAAGGLFFPADITRPHEVQEVFAQVKPWLVIHTAAYTDVDGCERLPEKAQAVNVEGTRIIAQACRAHDSKLVYISTDYVFDGTKRQPYSVDDAPQPLNEYGRSKWQGEQYVSRLVAEHLIVRTSWLFGRQGKNFVSTIAAKARTEPQLRVVDDQIGCPTATHTLAPALAALVHAVFESGADERAQGIYHVCNQGRCSWFEFAGEIVRGIGLQTVIVPITTQEAQRPAQRPAWSVLDTQRYVQRTGQTLAPWQHALREYLATNI